MKTALRVVRAVVEGPVGLFLPVNTIAGILTWRGYTLTYVIWETVWTSICLILGYLFIRDAIRILTRIRTSN
jgi:hypothetical protein